TADRNRSHWSTSKTPSYTKSVSWQHYPNSDILRSDFYVIIQETQNAHKNNSIKHLTTTQEFHIALFFNEKILFA
ncbi:hypothetical protein QU795_24625, partial [Escherichia coli]|nr:hypothetical protein [Escherichia coli]